MNSSGAGVGEYDFSLRRNLCGRHVRSRECAGLEYETQLEHECRISGSSNSPKHRDRLNGWHAIPRAA